MINLLEMQAALDIKTCFVVSFIQVYFYLTALADFFEFILPCVNNLFLS